MTIFLLHTFKIIEKYGWKMSIVLLAGMFFAGWMLMYMFEPAGSDLVRADVYWWWFIVTTTTVGYGDFAPASTGGRVVAMAIMLGGIGAIGIVITQLTTVGSEIRRMIMDGSAALNEKDHIAIMGYEPGKTEEVVKEIVADRHRANQTIVLCFDPAQAAENPMPDRVKAVKGKLTSKDVLERACLAEADRIVCDGKDDNETLVLALAACEVNRDGHIVAAVENIEESKKHIDRLGRNIECVPEGMVTMIVQAVLDPGITRLYNRFLSNLEGHSGYRLDIPENAGPWAYGDLFVHFKKKLGATILAAADSHEPHAAIAENPAWDHAVKGGMSLYYIAPSRISDIDFKAIKS